MNSNSSLRYCWFVAAMCMGSSARSGVWATEPVLGLVGEYSTNPALRDSDHAAETHGALLIDVPTTFSASSMSLSVNPSFRISNSPRYSSLASNYEHLTVVGDLESERNQITATGQFARDSSLYYNYAVNGTTGVRHDTALADLAWTRAFTERLNLIVDANSTRVTYGQSSTFATLNDYRYTAAQPTLSWNSSERSTLSLLGGVGLYDSSGGSTRSVNANFQVGFVRQLDELWTLSATAGYSRERNTISEYFGHFLLGTFRSVENGSVFSSGITRRGSRLQVTASASRSLTPSGFAFLSRVDTDQFSVHYPWSERWSIDGHVRWVKSLEPQVIGPAISQKYLDSGLSASWLVTELWTFTVNASRVTAKYTPPTVAVDASGFSLQLSRRFNRIEWH
jgi:hypothetical protein